MSETIQDNENQTGITDDVVITSSDTNEPITSPPDTGKGEKPLTLEELIRIPTVKSLIEKARSEEKDKLYKTLETKDKDITELREKLKGLQSQLEAKENENLSEVEILQKEIRKLETDLAKLNSDIETEREAARAEKKKAELTAYKERRLREVKEAEQDLVISLVGGNSEEEIEASIQHAILEYQTIEERILDKSKKEKPSSTPRVTNPPGIGGGLGIDPTKVKNMSLDEYKKYREKLLEAARGGDMMEV